MKLPDPRKLLAPKSKEYKEGQINWGPVSAVIISIVIYFVAQILGSLVISLYPLIHHWNHQQATDWETNSVYAQFFYVLIAEGISISVLWQFLRSRRASFKTLGLIKPRIRDLGYAAGGYVVYYIIFVIAVSVIQSNIHSFNSAQKQEVGFQFASGTWQLSLIFISLVVLPPLVEELLFRGLLFSGLKKAMPVIWAGLSTSILFALPHLAESSGGGILWIAGVDTFILSLVLVYLRQKTKSLWPGIMLHSLKNFVAFYLIFIVHAT